MRRILKKELAELYNKQMLIGLAVSFVLIVALGVFMTGAISGEMTGGGTVHVVDEDRTDFTARLVSWLEDKDIQVEMADSPEQGLEEKGWEDVAVLPEGLTAHLEAGEACEVENVTALTSTSALSFGGSGSAEVIQEAIRKVLLEENLEGSQAFLDEPATLVAYTHANGKTVQADSAAIISRLSLFDRLLPLALFLLVVLTSQTIITAIATEKTDKTLETLLTSPVPRSSIIAAKMIAALLVALTYAAVYALGFLGAMLMTVSGRGTEDLNVGEAFTEMALTRQAVLDLGLDISAAGWVGVLLQLMLTLGIALTASMILGGLTTDAKSAQTASMPILLCSMFPYMISMVSDIRGMAGAAQWILYAIPFTHTFIATGNLRFHSYGLFWGGMAYQAVFLAVLIAAALKLYNSDVLFTGQHRRHGGEDAEKS